MATTAMDSSGQSFDFRDRYQSVDVLAVFVAPWWTGVLRESGNEVRVGSGT